MQKIQNFFAARLLSLGIKIPWIGNLLMRLALVIAQWGFAGRLMSQASDRRLAEQIGQLIAPMVACGNHEAYFELWQEQGFHLTRNHFYSPIPDTRTLAGAWETPNPLRGVEMRVEQQIKLLQEEFSQFADEYNQIPTAATSDPQQYYLTNPFFNGVDGLALYCFIRSKQPKRIIEVGSGYSTLIATQAAQHNAATEMICIEPYPPDFLKRGLKGVSQLMATRVQEVDPALFQWLQGGDILFIDTSHVVKTGSDVNWLLLNIVPQLADGVIIHIHDIFFPNEYPKQWILGEHRFWTEQYLLQAFLAYNSQFEVLLSNSYLYSQYPDVVRIVFPNNPHERTGSSFWMRKIATL